MSFFESLVSEILETGLAVEQDIRCCSFEDVASLEAGVKKALPLAYKDYLLKIGRGAGRFFQGTDIFYPGVKDLKNEAIELLEENEEKFGLPDDAFVFSMHQGYEFLYFMLSENDDPEVYQYVEGEGEPMKVWSSFSSFVNEALSQHIQHFQS